MIETPLVINLSKSEKERLEKPDDILQTVALTRLDRLISEQLDGIPTKPHSEFSETSLSYPRPHNAILVQGGRGSGKTTFLLNALQRLQDGTDKDIAGKASDLHVLPMIDPTLIETKEHIVIVILSMIEAAIKDVADKNGQMQTARQSLSEGLGLLDGIGSSSAYGSEWEDADWVMSRGLHKAKKGRLFELKFGVYLETALNMLKKKAFVLAFDDVDTNFTHGHTILETIRKYLTSPRLVLLLSGDPDLYGRLLRRNIYSTFGKEVLRHDSEIIGGDKQHLGHAVLELEEQYLLKIVPPQNRIAMLPLGGIMLGSEVLVDSGKTPEPVNLAFWANKQIRKLLLEKEGQPQRFFDFISMEHLRLVIGYLRALNQDDIKASRQMILRVFETRLRTSQVPTNLLERGNFDHALRSAFEWLCKQDDAADLLSFGVPVDPVRAVVLHCLALALAQGIEAHNGGALRALFALALPVTMMRRPENSDKETRVSIFRFLWTTASPSLPEIAARIGTIDRSRRNEVGRIPASSFGSVGLTNRLTQKENLLRVYGLSAPVKGTDRPTVTDLYNLTGSEINAATANWICHVYNADYGDLQIRQNVSWFSIDDLIQDRTGKFSDVLKLISYKRFSARGEIFRSLSALSLFAVIGDLLMSSDIGDLTSCAVSATIPPFKRDKTQDEANFSPEIDDDPSDEELRVEEDAAGVSEDRDFDIFAKNLKDWHAFARDIHLDAAVSPAMLGSIASRIHDDLMDLDEKVTSSWKSGQILHRQITNILHGILVQTSGLPGRKESPKTSDRPLIEALGRIQAAGTEVSLHPLAIIVLSCPLIWAFLNPHDDDNLLEWAPNPLSLAASAALEEWQGGKGSQEAENFKVNADFGIWLVPPAIPIKIGPIVQSGNQRSVTVSGFYDVLNVVPRNVTK
ncbi:hypothetical protein [Pseudomonas sp. Irchel 3F6]|uniref:hypothetical protein n=1 Tax=Pseudomonas sp. Irchel 3F6 TaxID=2009003 RepID=UPI000BA4CE59|nr:hypothetical protein [Pseudomonas sp. Irchel 3F6]